MKSFMIRMLIRWDIRGYALEEVFPWRRLLHGVSTISGIEDTECVHFQEYHTTSPPYSVCVRNVFRSPAESIPHAYGIWACYKKRKDTPTRPIKQSPISTRKGATQIAPMSEGAEAPERPAGKVMAHGHRLLILPKKLRPGLAKSLVATKHLLSCISPIA